MRVLLLLFALLLPPGAWAQPADEAEREELRNFLDQTINAAESFEDKYDAEVWLVDMSARLERFVRSPYVKDPAYRLDLLKNIHAARPGKICFYGYVQGKMCGCGVISLFGLEDRDVNEFLTNSNLIILNQSVSGIYTDSIERNSPDCRVEHGFTVSRFGS